MSAVQQALRPVIIFGIACNVQMLGYRFVPLNYIQYTISWSGFAILLVALYKWTVFPTIFIYDMFWLTFVVNTISSILLTGLALLHKKKFQAYVDGLSVINTSLSQFDIPDEYRQLHLSAWRVVGILCLMVTYLIVINAQWAFIIFGRFTGSLVIFVLSYPNMIHFFAFLVICVILRYTDSRFDCINKYVGALVKHASSGKTWLFKYRPAIYDLPNPVILKKQEHIIWIIMHVHCDLCRVSRDFNALVSLQITLEIGTYFMYIICLFNYLYLRPVADIHCTLSFSCIARKVSVMWPECTWATLYIGRLIYFNHVCESVCMKANRTRIFVYNLLNSTNRVDLHRQAVQFIMQMVTHPLQFDAIGMFYFGYRFIYAFFGALSTVSVIILQSAQSTSHVHHNGRSVNVSQH